MLSGEMKQILIEKIEKFLVSHREKREKAKELVKIIKGLGLKVQPQIEGEKIRVVSPKKDDLQSVITHLRKVDFPLALTFCNYR